MKKERRIEMAGTTLGIYMPPEQPLSLVLNWGIKTQTTLCNYLDEYKKDLPSWITNERIKDLREQRKLKIPGDIWHWVKPRWQKEDIDPKPDAYGLFGGMIEQWEIENHPNDYFDYRITSEAVEETGLIIVRELKYHNGKSILDPDGKPKRISLFRRICLVYAENKKQGGGKVYEKFNHKTIEALRNPNQEEGHTYEVYFFHIMEADGTLSTEDHKGETRAPEIIPITSLYPRNSQVEGANWFYPKHAFGLKILLRQLIKEGKNEYKEPLAHLEKEFQHDDRLGFVEFADSTPTLDLSDEDAWLRATQGVKKI
ncbi:MAG: hypothetical protein AAB556_02250 [Patescibacteria group bacterium]